MPFSPSTAERLMRIAENKILSNSAHAPILPTSWTTLYELAKVPITSLELAIEAGRIRPDMRRQDVKFLLGWKSGSTKNSATVLKQLEKLWDKSDQDTRVQFLQYIQQEAKATS